MGQIVHNARRQSELPNQMKSNPEPSSQEVLVGLVERVTFHNAENGFCVLRAKARGHRDLVTVVGHAAIISAGEWITASGEWINDRAHGSAVQGAISQDLGAELDRRDREKSRLRDDPGHRACLCQEDGQGLRGEDLRCHRGRAGSASRGDGHRLGSSQTAHGRLGREKIIPEIMVFLHSNGVGTVRAVRIFKTYGADAVQVMTENPYRLARDIRGIGFKSADAIAIKLGIEKTAMIRLRAGISYALAEAMDEGHCGLRTDQLIPLAEELLEAPRELILTALELERSEGAVIADKVGDTACIFLAGNDR
jgi:exodeoxyribonuclease V alpha subunit